MMRREGHGGLLSVWDVFVQFERRINLEIKFGSI
jgi:hypothetical protein